MQARWQQGDPTTGRRTEGAAPLAGTGSPLLLRVATTPATGPSPLTQFGTTRPTSPKADSKGKRPVIRGPPCGAGPLAVTRGRLEVGTGIAKAGSMLRPTAYTFAALLSCAGLAVSACGTDLPQGTTEADPGGNDHYGDDFIGYKTSAASRAALESGSPGLSSSSGGTGSLGVDGAYEGAGGSVPLPATGGSPNLGGMGGLPVPENEPASWRDPLRGAAPAENPYFPAAEDAVSTFSIDVDSGSYTLTRASLNAGVLPERSAIRIEEFLNYFHFHYEKPAAGTPLSLYTELGACPWNPAHDLLLLGVQGQDLTLADAPPLNLVFLVDVSGSMAAANKLPLLQSGFRMLARQLRPQDRVSLVTYAGWESVLLSGVHGDEHERIEAAIAGLSSSGSTNGAGGIQKAYELAAEHFIDGGSNRVVLGTDADFNVGISSQEELVAFIAAKRDTGVFLSVYGFGAAWGEGNFQDDIAEQLADNGNGIYYYIDTPEEARRAFAESASGSLFTVAKDVKLQVEFNPMHVKGYRLIGYENRVLADGDFSNDAVDAGELGAGLSVTALYEIIPAAAAEGVPPPLSGTVPESVSAAESSESETTGEFDPLGADDYVQVRLRYKKSESTESTLEQYAKTLTDRPPSPSYKFLFAAGVTEFASLLLGSQYLESERQDELADQLAKTRILDREGAIHEAEVMLAQALELAP